jgi:hypothetical protein
MGEVINTLMEFSEDILIFGCDHSIWQLSGDPMVGGRFDLISDVVGMPLGAPYCKDPDGTIYFMSGTGHVYSLEAGAAKSLKNLTATRLPSDFSAINLNTNRIEFQWDEAQQGIRVFIMPLTNAGSTCWFYSARLDAWFKDTFAASRVPYSTYVLDADDPGDRVMLVGNQDGYIRYFDDNADEDDQSAIDAYVVLGPFQVEKGLYPFVFQSIQAVLDASSDDVTYQLYVGNSAEDASALSGVDGTGDFVATRSVTHHPRRRGYAAYVKLFNNSNNETWSMEAIRVKIQVIATSRKRQNT